MKEYTIIGELNYNNKRYEMLVDEERRYYFLNINNNDEYEYVTLKEYIELIDKFAAKENILLFLGIKKNEKKKLRLIPRILIGATAVILSASLLLGINNSKPTYSTTNYTTSSTYVETLSIEDRTDQEIEKYLQQIAEETENFKLDTIRQSGRLTVIYDFSELDGVFNNTKEDITYNTIREKKKKNHNINQKYKTLLLTLVTVIKSVKLLISDT